MVGSDRLQRRLPQRFPLAPAIFCTRRYGLLRHVRAGLRPSTNSSVFARRGACRRERTRKGSFASNELPRDFRRRSHFRTHLCARFPLVFSRLHTFARLCPFPSTHTHSRAFACMTQASIIAHRISPFSAPKSAQISPKMRTDLPRPRRAALSLVVPLCAPPASTYRRRTTGRTRPRSPSFS